MLSFKELANEGIVCKQYDDYNGDAIIFHFEKGEAQYRHRINKQELLELDSKMVPFSVIENILCEQAKIELDKLLEGSNITRIY